MIGELSELLASVPFWAAVLRIALTEPGGHAVVDAARVTLDDA